MTATEYDIVYIPLGAAALGGAERSLLELAGTVKRNGMRPLVLSELRLASTEFPTLVAQQTVDLRFVDWAPEHGLLRNVRSAIAVFRRIRSPVIHFNISWRPSMWVVALIARLLTNAKLVGTMRAMPDPFTSVPRRRHLGFIPGFQLWRIPSLLVGRVWARLLDVTVSVNGNDYPNRLIRDFGFDAERLCTIRNGIRPISPSEWMEPSTDACSADTSAGREGAHVMYVGRVSEEKGIDYLLRALTALPETYSLTIVGDGPALDSLRDLAKQLGISARVGFSGFLSEPYRQMIKADVIAVPSVWEEAFGRVVIEAMCLEKPVIATFVGGMAEIFKDGEEGLYVSPRDVPALAAALKRLGRSASLRRRIGTAARQRVLMDYTLDRVAGQYMRLYASSTSGTSTSKRFMVAAARTSRADEDLDDGALGSVSSVTIPDDMCFPSPHRSDISSS